MAQRNTKQRELVLEVVRSRCDHPTAEQVYDSVCQIDPSVGKSTVYRNLRVLEEQGDILCVNATEANHYDLRTDPHHHVQCEVCGNVVDVPLDSASFSLSVIELETGFKVKDPQVLFTGICPECQAKR